jgi:hypothetical protein
MISKLKENLS